MLDIGLDIPMSRTVQGLEEARSAADLHRAGLRVHVRHEVEAAAAGRGGRILHQAGFLRAQPFVVAQT